MRGRGVREFGMDMYTLLYFQWIINKDLLYRTRDSAQCYAAAWMARECGGECICMTDFLCCAPETLTALLNNYTPI